MPAYDVMAGAVRVKVAATVLSAAMLGLACEAREDAAGPTRSDAPAGAAKTLSPMGGAYIGCGQPIPAARLWDETTDDQVVEAISEARRCAARHGRRLLLEFVAPWCSDCREMARLDESPLVAETRSERFERVRINVGRWDRHEALRRRYEVRALATYIVLDPETSKPLARTTLEPISKPGETLRAQDWAAWLASH